MAERIQRKRTKGWKMPPNTVYVGRPTKWGNPYRVGQAVGPNAEPMSAEEAVACYRRWIMANQASWERWRIPTVELRGKNLACWCRLAQPCHADVLLELANCCNNPATTLHNEIKKIPSKSLKLPASYSLEGTGHKNG